MILPEKWYDILAWINRVFLPALGALVTAILALCKVDAQTITLIDGIILAVTTFLGALLQDSKAKYEVDKNEN